MEQISENTAAIQNNTDQIKENADGIKENADGIKENAIQIGNNTVKSISKMCNKKIRIHSKCCTLSWRLEFK